MKVVLFCGGLGTRLREYSETVPKPLVPVGPRPIIWNLMKFYAHFGHFQFVLCLGHLGEMIKDYFLSYNECLSNDFVFKNGGKSVELLNSDINEWEITFAETGLKSNLGERLLHARHYLEDDDIFLANYSDGLSNIDLKKYVDLFSKSDAIAAFVGTASSQSFHMATANEEGVVTKLGPISDVDYWMNSGFFVLRKEIFNYIRPGEELVEEPFQRLITKKRLMMYRHDGFWMAMDTYKDKKRFDTMYENGDIPWAVWNL